MKVTPVSRKTTTIFKDLASGDVFLVPDLPSQYFMKVTHGNGITDPRRVNLENGVINTLGGETVVEPCPYATLHIE
jgi:hypothetical protein